MLYGLIEKNVENRRLVITNYITLANREIDHPALISNMLDMVVPFFDIDPGLKLGDILLKLKIAARDNHQAAAIYPWAHNAVMAQIPDDVVWKRLIIGSIEGIADLPEPNPRDLEGIETIDRRGTNAFEEKVMNWYNVAKLDIHCRVERCVKHLTKEEDIKLCGSIYRCYFPKFTSSVYDVKSEILGEHYR